jgi:hypothetical protein
MFNTYCFATAVMVTRTRLSVTLHVHCLCLGSCKSRVGNPHLQMSSKFLRMLSAAKCWVESAVPLRPYRLHVHPYLPFRCVSSVCRSVTLIANIMNPSTRSVRMWIFPTCPVSRTRKSVFTSFPGVWSGPGSSVGIATGYGLDGPGIESRWGRDFSHTPRTVLGPTQPPVQWVPGISGGKAAGTWC